MAKKNKYYVVWKGREKGVFHTWEECKRQIEGYENAMYKSFDDIAQAEKAYGESPEKYIYAKKASLKKNISETPSSLPVADSIATDAACSGNPGKMEYQGVYVKDGRRLFYFSHPNATNNIGEFLAIVHGLAYLKKHNLPQPLYTDSRNAMLWVRQKKCRTRLKRTEKNKDLFEYIARAEQWLENNTYSTPVLKWNTEEWGEIPADFGRK